MFRAAAGFHNTVEGAEGEGERNAKSDNKAKPPTNKYEPLTTPQ